MRTCNRRSWRPWSRDIGPRTTGPLLRPAYALGLFEAGFAPGIILYLTYWFPAKRMAAVMGVYMLAGPIGSIIGSAGSALIIEATDGIAGLSGWQWMFAVQGLPCVLLGIIFWRYMTDRPNQAGWLTADERALLAKRLDAAAAQKHTNSFATALKNPTVYVMSGAYFGIMCGIYAVSLWLRDARRGKPAVAHRGHRRGTVSDRRAHGAVADRARGAIG